jgi:hypothetical protein
VRRFLKHQLSLSPFPFPPPSCARKVELQLCVRGRLEGSAVRVCVTVRVCASELLDCGERLQREVETDRTEGSLRLSSHLPPY